MVAAVGWRYRLYLLHHHNCSISKSPTNGKWKRCFELFLSASGLDKEEETRQVSTLMYCLGEDAEGVLVSTNIGDDDHKKYREVMSKFDE